jgi:hypothetical protein
VESTSSAWPPGSLSSQNYTGVICPGRTAMSPKRVRFEAMLFRSDSVRFEACSGFRPGNDVQICRCGWLDGDHPDQEGHAQITPIRRLRRRAVRIPERKAS